MARRKPVESVASIISGHFRHSLGSEAARLGLNLSDHFLTWISQDVGRRYERMLDGEIYTLLATIEERNQPSSTVVKVESES